MNNSYNINQVNNDSIILEGYNQLEKYKSELKNIEKKFESVINYCGKNDFEINGTGYDKNIESCYNMLKKLENAVSEYNKELLAVIESNKNEKIELEE